MSLSFPQLLVILLLVFILFGAGNLPKVMSDIGKGLKSFKKAMKEDEETGSKGESKSSKDNNDQLPKN